MQWSLATRDARARRFDGCGRIAVACTFACLSSCVGASVYSPNEVRMPNPSFGYSNSNTIYPNADGPALTAAEWKQAFGTPDETRRVSDVEERWTYSGDERLWKGVIVYALIPIPLCIPIGHERLTLVVRDDKVVEATVVKFDEWSFTYGVTFGMCDGFGVGAEKIEWDLPDESGRDVNSMRRKPKSVSD